MCLYPRNAWRWKGTKILRFDSIPFKKITGEIVKESDVEQFTLPCGKCVECQKQKSEEWVVRCKEELKYHKTSCFITLTYAKTNGDLNYEDFQKFMKRLRKNTGKEIRFFMCGEYGDKGNRPHYHCILFGIDFNEDKKKLYIDSRGNQLYTSAFLEKTWKLGICTVGEVTSESIRYCTKYMNKFDFREHKVKPFIRTSQGIGKKSISPKQLLTNSLYQDGKSVKLPRYFLRKLVETYGFDDTDIKELRERRSKIFSHRIRHNYKVQEVFSRYFLRDKQKKEII